MMRLRQAKARCRSRKRRIQAKACRWLHQAVINFVNRWRTGKQRFEQLTARQQALRASLRQLAQAYARILRELDGALPADCRAERLRRCSRLKRYRCRHQFQATPRSTGLAYWIGLLDRIK